MGVETVFKHFRETLEQEGFEKRVFEYDFNKLNDPTLSSMVILEFGKMTKDEIDTYGPTFARTWQINAHMYHGSQDKTGADVHGALLVDIDKFINAMEKQFHLGAGKASDIRKVKVKNIEKPQMIETEEGIQNWLHTVISTDVEETDTPVGGE